MRKKNLALIPPDEIIQGKIYLIRGEKIMLDENLALLYHVETKVLNQTVKRHLNRFPSDFMFRLTEIEFAILKSQIVTSSKIPDKQKHGGRRTMPLVFTEHGIAMLPGILNSDTAVNVNIQIIRVFTRMRKLLLTHKDIMLKLEQMEKQVTANSEDVILIFNTLKNLLQPKPVKRELIGFKVNSGRKNKSK
jgi:hypothetical protein